MVMRGSFREAILGLASCEQQCSDGQAAWPRADSSNTTIPVATRKST